MGSLLARQVLSVPGTVPGSTAEAPREADPRNVSVVIYHMTVINSGTY